MNTDDFDKKVIRTARIDNQISDAWIYLWVHKEMSTNIVNLKWAIEAIENLYDYENNLVNTPLGIFPITKIEAADRILIAIQNYKMYLNSKAENSEN